MHRSLCRKSFSGIFLSTRQFSFSGEQLSSKKFNRDFKKKMADKYKGVPANFIKYLKVWPKLLRCEIEQQNSEIKSLLAASDNNWSELESRGLAIGNLSVVAEFVDPINGRLLALENKSIKNRNKLLNKGFRIGSPVMMCEAEDLRKVAECVFLKSNRKEITLKVGKQSQPRFDPDRVYVILPSIEVGALQSLTEVLTVDNIASSPGIKLLKFAFNESIMPSIHNDRIPNGISDELNISQTRAVAAALNKKRPFVCIQGPPGTGKTRVVAEIIKLLSEKNQKVLVCAPSNVAVDTAMNKAVHVMRKSGVEFENLGIEEDEQTVGARRLDEAIAEHPQYLELSDLSQAISDAREEKANKKEEKLKKQFWKLKKQILKDCYKRRRVIFCTLSSSIVQRLAQVNWEPDVVIIDEAAQCIEPLAWTAIVKASRCILVGDHAQLPAVIKSDEAKRSKLGVSLMERLCSDFKNSNISHLLSVQYRMNESIMRWPSDRLYESRLVSDESVSNIRLSDISLIPENHMLDVPLLMFNTAAQENDFLEEEYRLSFRNFGEASFVSSYANFLVENAVAPSSIGIITPYYAQVQTIRDLVDSKIVVNTVDAFQGQEREVILFSMVRNNSENVIGFLREVRRMNVAMTRARRQFCLVGNSNMMQKNKDLRTLFRFFKEFGSVTSPNKVDFTLHNQRIQRMHNRSLKG